MKRSLFIAVLVTALFAFMAASSALATIHPIVNAECSAAAANGTPADTQNPPGITPGSDPDPDHATTAQPLLVAAGAAFKPAGCPAPNK